MTHTIAILGFGTVGSSVARLLGTRGDAPVRLTHIFNRDVDRKRAGWVPDDVVWTERIEDVFAADVDIVVELTGGLEPAGTWIRRALESGTSVVTANKPLIAQAGPELTEIASRSGAQLGFEASVAGGVPVLCGIQDGLVADRLMRVLGILNGTCNYILTRIEGAGLAFGAALQEAKDLGFAEANPTDDIDGYDARDKLAILTRLGLGLLVNRDAIPCLTISGVQTSDFALAHHLGCTIRQVSRAEPGRQAATLTASVRPAFIPRDSPLAAIEGSQNIVQTTGTYGGTTSFVGLGAGGDATAVAVTSDILAIARGRRRASAWAPAATPTGRVSDDFETPHCVRVLLTGTHTPADLVQGLTAQGMAAVEALDVPSTSDGPRAAGLRVAACPTATLERALAQVRGTDDALVFPILES